MPKFGAAVAIIEAGKILLMRREDFAVWCLPGGEINKPRPIEILSASGIVHLSNTIR